MKARELERLLTAHGVSSAKMDGVTRELRASNRLPKGGRGTNAPHINPIEAASTLIAVAGSSKANEANVRLEKLGPLRSTNDGMGDQTFHDALSSCLNSPSGPDELLEIRISRTKRRATFNFLDGRVIEFLPAKADVRPARFYVEGILPRGLLQLIAQEMAKDRPAAQMRTQASRDSKPQASSADGK